MCVEVTGILEDKDKITSDFLFQKKVSAQAQPGGTDVAAAGVQISDSVNPALYLIKPAELPSATISCTSLTTAIFLLMWIQR